MALLATGQVVGGSNEQFFLDEGTELYAAQKYKEAIAQFEQLLERDPTNWSANFVTAHSYLCLFHTASERPHDKEYAEKGLAAFERTLKLVPPSPQDREAAEKLYLSFLDATGDTGKAIAYVEAQLASRPNDPVLLRVGAALCKKQGDFTKAFEYYEKRASLDATNKEAWYLLGVNYWGQPHDGGLAVSQEARDIVIDKGIAALDKALQLDPNYFDALSYLSLLYQEKAKALAAVERNAEANDAFAKADEYEKRAIDIRRGLTAGANAK
jgi:tetratricopeptide (TPR) repeat protein